MMAGRPFAFVVVGVAAASGSCAFDIREEPLSDVEVSWSLSRGHGAVECGEVGVARVRVEFRSRTDDRRFAEWFECAPGHGVAGMVPVDDYAVRAVALGASDETRGVVEGARLQMDGAPVEVMPALEFSFVTPVPAAVDPSRRR